MTLTADLYWSFRSPYSYLGTARIVDLAKEYDLEINVRPVYPIAIRTPDFFKQANPLFVPYLLRDVVRVAEFRGMSIAMPRPDPVAMNMETLAISDEQPYIFRLTRLGVEAQRQGRGLPFLDEVSRLLWNGEVDGWDQGDHLPKAAGRAGLDLAGMEANIDGNEDNYEAEIAANQETLKSAGHWGVPTLVFEDEPFFGQDRIDLCTWRMKQRGLEKR